MGDPLEREWAYRWRHKIPVRAPIDRSLIEEEASMGTTGYSSVRDGITREAIEARKQAWEAGYERGKRVAANILGTIPYSEPYLQYLYLLGVGQAIANAGAELGGNLYARASDPQRATVKE